MYLCVCVRECVYMCVRVCMCVWVCVCARAHGRGLEREACLSFLKHAPHSGSPEAGRGGGARRALQARRRRRRPRGGRCCRCQTRVRAVSTPFSAFGWRREAECECEGELGRRRERWGRGARGSGGRAGGSLRAGWLRELVWKRGGGGATGV